MRLTQQMHRKIPPLMPSAPELAFVRAWAEGLDMAQAWLRYLGTEGAADPRRVRFDLQRLLDMLRSLARAKGRPELAVLLRRDPEAMADRARVGPSLEAFMALQPADFYSEAELLALYQVEHGAPDARSAVRRRQRLRARLVQALQWLQQQAVKPPEPGDQVAAWLDERVAGRLAAVGITRLAELQAWVAARGYHWHRTVPRLGSQGAARVVAWLVQQAPSLGALPAWVLQPPALVDRAALTPLAQTGIVPLERLLLPPALDGHLGSNRVPMHLCKLKADTDLAAVQLWLARWPCQSHTWRSYRREAERFVLWAVMVRHKPLSSLDGADCAAYRGFTAAPGAAWCAPRHTARWRSHWRPFEAGLSPGSTGTAVRVLRALCAWLVRQRYLALDPWLDEPAGELASGQAPVCASEAGVTVAAAANGADGRAGGSAQRAPPQRPALCPAHLQALGAWLTSQPPSPAHLRLACALALASGMGLRLSELCAAEVGWLVFVPAAPTGHRPALRLPQRHGRWRCVPVPPVAQAWLVQQLELAARHGAGNPVATDQVGDGGGANDCVAAIQAAILAIAQATRANLVALPQPDRAGPRAWPAQADTARQLQQLVAQLPPGRPLLARLTDAGRLTPQRLHLVMRRGMAGCARDLSAAHGDWAQALAHATPDSLRAVAAEALASDVLISAPAAPTPSAPPRSAPAPSALGLRASAGTAVVAVRRPLA